MTIVAIDPGTTQSQFVIFDGSRVLRHGFEPNDVLLQTLPQIVMGSEVVIEGVQSMGMLVGQEVFDTCVWIGRFYERCAQALVVPTVIYRREVKLHLCGNVRAKDPNIRQAILDRFGGKDATRKGGSLHGVAGHGWSALALAITFRETRRAVA